VKYPPPDLVIEVDITRSSLNRSDIAAMACRKYGVST